MKVKDNRLREEGEREEGQASGRGKERGGREERQGGGREWGREEGVICGVARV